MPECDSLNTMCTPGRGRVGNKDIIGNTKDTKEGGGWGVEQERDEGFTDGTKICLHPYSS